MPQRPDDLRETASQTAGPYVHIGLAPSAAMLDRHPADLGKVIAGPGVPGLRIRVEGTVFDGTGTPLRDALIEVWQADAAGLYPHPDDPRAAEVAPGFRGFGRVVPDFESGLWVIETVKPGRVAGRNGRAMAPHISLWIVARGINIGLSTRMYFADEDNSADPVLALIDPPARRATLIAAQAAPGLYRFDIRLQGDGETVFLDI